MRALCYHWETGALLHDVLLFQPDTLYPKHSVNTYATPTGALDGEHLYVHFGRYGTACLDRATGEIRWKRNDLQCEHIQGPGSSLLIYRDKLIVHMEGSDIQYIVALDKETGETIWQTERPKEVYDLLEPIGKKAYITPIIVRVEGRDLLISNGSAACIAYDPDTGTEVWRIVQGEDSTISMPVYSGGILFFYTSFIVRDGDKYCELLAVDPKGRGDIGDTHVLWRLHSPILQLSTPVVVDGLLYTVDSRSLLSCLDAATGATLWSEKLRGKYNASPVFAGGHLYLSSTRGDTHVFKAGREWEPVAENDLEGEIWATPAFTDGAILVRTSKYLYKIGEQ
jgi:outer membrane protein assembly factor BamB